MEAWINLNRKAVLPFLFVAVLFASLATSNHPVKADSTDPIYLPSGITLYSPLNKTYNTKFLTLNFTLACGLGIQYSANYNIDGKHEGPMPYVIDNPEEMHVVYRATGLVKLPELSEGSHSLTINLQTSQNNNHIKPSYTDTVNFAIDLTPPSLSILSPLNKTYTTANLTTTNIPLCFVVNETTSHITISLDGQNDTSTNGNTTLTGLSMGQHNVTVYARDLAGNTGASETVSFNVAAEPEPQPAPKALPTALIAAVSGASIAITSVTLLLYFKKRKR
jgi:hypothetical protein